MRGLIYGKMTKALIELDVEKRSTDALNEYGLEANSLLVITTPSDNGWMDKKHVDDKRTTCSSTTLNKVKQTILDSVTNNTKDFYISYKAKNTFYDNDTAETKPADIKIWFEDKMKDPIL